MKLLKTPLLKKTGLAVLYFYAGVLFGQIDNNQVIAPSPTAASLGQFGNIPVGYYTGTPNISIPLYEIKSGSLTLPITMSYQSTGLRVAQDASWVGLGWSLSAGGLISRVVRGNDDFATGGYSGYHHNVALPPWGDDNKYIYASEIDALYEFCWNANPTCMEIDFEDFPEFSTNPVTNQNLEFLAKVGEGSNDGEPDIFSFNFGGYSGTFVIDKLINDSRAFCFKSNNLKIEGNYYVGTSEFKITAPDGNVYLFGATPESKEVIHNKYNNNAYGFDPSTTVGLSGFTSGNMEPITSWYLNSITSPNGDIIEFSYDIGESLSSITESHKRYVPKNNNTIWISNGGGPSIGSHNYDSFSRQHIFDVILKKIKFRNGYIDFETSDREDIEKSTGAGAPTPQKLSHIKVRDALGNLIKDIDLDHSYFISHDYANNPSTAYHGKRLKLDAIQIDGQDNTYTFEYENPDGLPDKYSKKYDEWGFYSTLFSASGSVLDFPKERSDYIGDDVTTGVLKSITYPTKGKTEFEYEPHDLNGVLNYDIQDITYTAILQYLDLGNPPDDYRVEPITPFIITSAPPGKWVTLSYDSNLNDPNNKAFLRNSDGLALRILSPGENQSPILLTEGTYTLEVRNIPIGYKGELTASFTDYVPIYTAGGKGNGIRIKNITNKDFSGNVIGLKHFIYTEDGTDTSFSSGSILTRPEFEYTRNITITDGPNRASSTDYLVKSSNSLIPSGFHSPPNVAGYGKVTVQEGLNGDIGSTTYEYYNEVYDHYDHYGYDDDFPEMPRIFDTRNGQLLSITENNSQGKVIKKTINNYELKERTSVKGVKYYKVPFDVWGYWETIDNVRYYDNFSEWWVTSSVIETLYDENGSNPISSTTYYDYENSDHKNLTKTTTVNSKGETIITTNTYPQDVTYVDETPSGTVSSMVSDHVIAPVLKTETTVGGNLVQARINNYTKKTHTDENNVEHSMYLPLNVKALKTGTTSDYDKKIEFVAYDNTGRVLEIKKPNGTSVSYLWGYNSEYPVAKIENATKAQIDALNLDMALINSAATLDSAMRSELQTIRTGLPQAMVTTYTYDPLMGVTSMTDSKGNTTYYTYDDFNRLKFIKDPDEKVLSKIEYHYKSQP